MTAGDPLALAMVGGIAEIAPIFIGYGLHRWGRWVVKRRGSLAWRLIRWLPTAGMVFYAAGLLVAVVMLLRTFASAAHLGSSDDKALVLSNGISEAMNCSALVTLPAWGLFAVSALVFATEATQALAQTPGALD